MVSTYKGLQLFNSRMVGCHLLSWRNLQKKIAFFRLFSRERSETCDTPKGIYFSELKNLGGGGVRDSPCAYASCIYFPCVNVYVYDAIELSGVSGPTKYFKHSQVSIWSKISAQSVCTSFSLKMTRIMKLQNAN